MKVRVLVLHAPGTNRDREAAWACALAGGTPEIVHLNQLLAGERRLLDYGFLVLPGGFSYGDYLRAGAMAAHAYAAPGAYTATLTVSDDLGLEDTDTVRVTVVDPNYIAPPTELTGVAAKGSVALRWKDNASNETAYYVERGTYNKRTKTYAWTRVAVLAANATAYSESVARGTWYYRVQAYSAVLERTSDYSNTVKLSVK